LDQKKIFMNSLFNDLQCPSCGEKYSGSNIQTVCQNKNCLSTLFARYRLPEGSDSRKELSNNTESMWRYANFLPVLSASNIVSLGEGLTPLIPLQNLKYMGNENNIQWKDESGNPTGSFKARGISAAISKAKELGIKSVSIPTAGNAGGALAAYCARGNMNAQVFMPKDTPKVFKEECLLYGAKVTEVEGSISDCGKMAEKLSLENGWFQIATLKEPYRLEGKKTMGYEIAEQYSWKLPEVILYPTGGGTGLIGIWKAFDEMEKMGWIDEKRPKMVAVQSTSCDGIVRAFSDHLDDSDFVDGGFTIANGLRVPKPYASKIILKLLKESKGAAIGINDTEIREALLEIAKKEGMLIAPEGAALWVGYKKLRKSNFIKPGDKILLLNTGTGYKYLENITL
jgi:threonine synthase